MSETFKEPDPKKNLEKKNLEKPQPPTVRYEREGKVFYDSEKEKKPGIFKRMLRRTRSKKASPKKAES